jgi:Golgi SNAP receptor complex protein 1
LAQRLATTATANTSSTDSTDLLLSKAESGTSAAGSALISLEQEEEASLRHELDRTLKNLQEVIAKLAVSADQTNKPQHLLLVKRYREILLDLTSDFNKTSQAIERKRQEARLFQGRSLAAGGASGQDAGMEHLLRERNHIHNSLNASSAVLDQASNIHSDLRSQGRSLRGVQGLVGKITGNIPGLNRLVENIRQKRSRDDKIVAGVIASCILFTLWYIFG